jgi:hypothetical protein
MKRIQLSSPTWIHVASTDARTSHGHRNYVSDSERRKGTKRHAAKTIELCDRTVLRVKKIWCLPVDSNQKIVCEPPSCVFVKLQQCLIDWWTCIECFVKNGYIHLLFPVHLLYGEVSSVDMNAASIGRTPRWTNEGRGGDFFVNTSELLNTVWLYTPKSYSKCTKI